MSITELSPTQFLIAVVVAALLATGVFAHASRHGSRHATAWGVATFLFAGIAVPVYFIRYLLIRRR
jgi:Zn-dependent protease